MVCVDATVEPLCRLGSIAVEIAGCHCVYPEGNTCALSTNCCPLFVNRVVLEAEADTESA
jgi:hypothetical protein